MESMPTVGATVAPPSGDPQVLVPPTTLDKTVSKVNTYAAKKSVAQRMMDIALLTSNANQLRYVLRFGPESPTYTLSVSLIALSLALQITVGVFLIFRVKANAKQADKERAHNLVVTGVFLITIVNVLVTAFSLEVPEKAPDIVPRLGAFNDTALKTKIGEE